MSTVDWHGYPFLAGWALWVLYWRISSVGVKRAQWREPTASRATHIVPMLLGVALIILGGRLGWLSWPLGPAGPASYWAGVALLVAGLSFSIWARSILGTNWSAMVTVKSGHELIRRGPYRWVRHPIYTGMLTALVGGALAEGRLHAWLGVLVITAAFIRKLRIEEQVMTERFPEEYPRYRAQSAALLPGIY
jgi:protein-S-isoprenylcysteine O-methyltransferase Ste14